MATFLNGPGVQSSLTDLMKNTDKELFIISPYLKISILMKNYLKSIDQRKLPITITYRSDSKINEDDLEFFQELNNLKLYHCENLHTKCYINEKEGIITSMNLHEHSQTHNWEMGIQFSKQNDPEIYSDVTKELRFMGSHLKQQSLSKTVAEPKQKYHAAPQQKTPPKIAYKPTEAPNKGLLDKIFDTVTGEAGFCIRCGKGIPKFDLNKPYCDKCYASWSRYKNIKYPEKYCHGCGGERVKVKSTFEKPLCKGCFTRFYKT
jgi:hypothetical protein